MRIIQMSKKELERGQVIIKILDGKLTRKKASLSLRVMKE